MTDRFAFVLGRFLMTQYERPTARPAGGKYKGFDHLELLVRYESDACVHTSTLDSSDCLIAALIALSLVTRNKWRRGISPVWDFNRLHIAVWKPNHVNSQRTSFVRVRRRHRHHPTLPPRHQQTAALTPFRCLFDPISQITWCWRSRHRFYQSRLRRVNVLC